MCGPVDFQALSVCAVHIAELSAAGIAAYGAHRIASIYRETQNERNGKSALSARMPLPRERSLGRA